MDEGYAKPSKKDGEIRKFLEMRSYEYMNYASFSRNIKGLKEKGRRFL